MRVGQLEYSTPNDLMNMSQKYNFPLSPKISGEYTNDGGYLTKILKMREH